MTDIIAVVKPTEEQILWALRCITDGAAEEFSAAGIIEKKFGFEHATYGQELRSELMQITNAFCDADKNSQEWTRIHNDAKDWLRKRLCAKCVKVMEQGF